MGKWYEKEEDQLYQDFDDGLISEEELFLALKVLTQEVAEDRLEAAKHAHDLAMENY